MYKRNIIFVCVFAVVCFTDSATPPYLTKCKSDDSNCILETSKVVGPILGVGIPDLKVPSSDPLVIKNIDASEGNLIFTISDATVVGLKNCIPQKITRDAAKSKISMSILCSATLDGQYNIKGSILLVPIEGKGAIHVDLNSCLVNIETDIIDKDGEDGKKHWNIKTWTHNFELKEKSKLVFENLFDGNEVLGQAVRDLLKTNSNEVIQAIGPKVIKAVVAKVLKHVNYFFKAIPIEDLSLD